MSKGFYKADDLRVSICFVEALFLFLYQFFLWRHLHFRVVTREMV